MQLLKHQIILAESLLTVVADISINEDLDDEYSHVDNPSPSYVVSVSVDKIHSVHVMVLNKEDIDITKHFDMQSNLRARLISSICEELESVNIRDLKQAA